MKQLDSLLKKIFPSKRGHNQQLIQETQAVADRVHKWIVEFGTPYGMRYSIQDLDLSVNRWIEYYFWELAQIFLDNYKLTPQIKKETIKSWAVIDKRDEAVIINILIRQAFLDIYCLIIAWRYLGIGTSTLKWILYFNMVSWNKDRNVTLTGIIQSHVDRTEWHFNISKETLLKELKQNKWTWKKEQAACPFYHTDNRKAWVDDVWEYVENTVIPEMEKNYWDSNYIWEQFWSTSLAPTTTDTSTSEEELPSDQLKS